jgi:hypothetical protein
MRKTLVMLAAAVALFGATAAQAQLTISGVTPSPATFTPGSTTTLTFMGTVTNNTGSDVDSGNASLSFGGGLDIDFDTTPFASAFGPLANGDSYTGTLFTLTLNPGQMTGFDGLLVLEGLDAFGDVLGSGEYAFSVTPGTAEVPEPGVTALLVGSLVGGGMLLRRRRN